MPQATLLAVDDEPPNVSLLSQQLRPEYQVVGTLSGASALALMASELPDLVLLARVRAHLALCQAELLARQLQRIVQAAPMHDLGKFGIPDCILLNPGRLTPDEPAVMQNLPRIGDDTTAKAMDTVRSQPASDVPAPGCATERLP